MVELPCEKDFQEKVIPTKDRPIQMNEELIQICKKEIKDHFLKGFIRKSKSHWSCSAFFVKKQTNIERGVPHLVINYKPLNQAFSRIRYLMTSRRYVIFRVFCINYIEYVAI